MSGEYNVQLTWDDEAAVWIATSDEIEGFVLEADSVDQLIKRTVKAVPELLDLNGQERRGGLHFSFDLHERISF